MGERKGTNKYYPPDYDPRAGGLNKWQGTHALRERARKIHIGIIIVRFEMPFNIWCEGCKNHIGMGVRYNAEKKKVGMYYTTPVFEFKMKCHLCDNHFLIKTDPANLEYLVMSGARRQENRWDPTQNEQVVPETKETQKRLFDDSMFKLEHGTDDQNTAESTKTNLVELYNRNENTWSDNYSANCKLRHMFRKTKNELKIDQAKDVALLKKSSLNLTLLPEEEEDRRMASILSLKLKPSLDVEKNTELLRKSIIKKLMVVLRDGRTLIGYLRSVDQFANLVLHKTIERIHVGKEYGDIPRGVFIVRGENVVLLGEIDPQKEANLPLTQVTVDDILDAQRREQESKQDQQRLLSKALKERGLNLMPDLTHDDMF